MFLWTRRKFFWQPCQKFSCKNTGFSCQNPKNQLFNSFIWRFFLCTLRLLLQHTWLFFCQNRENSLKVPKEMIIVKITLINFFLKNFSQIFWRHVKCTLATCRIFSPKFGYFRSETKNDRRITLLSKRASKRSATPVGYIFGNFDPKFTPKIQ